MFTEVSIYWTTAGFAVFSMILATIAGEPHDRHLTKYDKMSDPPIFIFYLPAALIGFFIGIFAGLFGASDATTTFFFCLPANVLSVILIITAIQLFREPVKKKNDNSIL